MRVLQESTACRDMAVFIKNVSTALSPIVDPTYDLQAYPVLLPRRTVLLATIEIEEPLHIICRCSVVSIVFIAVEVDGFSDKN